MFKRENILIAKQQALLILLITLLLTGIVFRQFFTKGFLPIPADIITAGYYPWADSSWGYPVRVPIKNSLPSDVPSLLYPWRVQALEIFKSGYLPLWNHTILLGTPLFANFQSAVLNPVNVLFFVLPTKLAWSWQVILQIPLLFLTTFLFLRNLKLSLPATVFGALCFTLSGQVLVWLEYNTLVYTYIYFPLLFFLVDSGYPLNTLYTLVFLALYFLYRILRSGNVTPGKFILLFLGIIGGLGLSAIQLIPGQEMANLSVRAFDNTAIAGDVKYLPLSHILSFFMPDLFGNPGTQNYWSSGSFDNFSFFIPAVGAYFFLLSLFTRTAFRRGNLIFLLFCVISLFWAVASPLTEAFGSLSFAGIGAAVNTRVLFIFTFSASVLAAFGFEEVLKNKVSLFCKILPLTVFFAIVLAFLIAYQASQKLEKEVEDLVASNISPSALFTDAGENALNSAREGISNFKIGLRNTVIPTSVALLTFALITINFRRFNMLVIPLLVLAVLPTFDKYLSFVRPDLVFPETQAMTRLQELTGIHRFEREKAEILPSNTWSLYGLSSPSGQNAFAPLSAVRYLDMINRGKLDDRLLTRFVHVENTKSPLFDTLDIETVAYLDRHVKESIPYKDGRPFPWIMPNDFTELANIDTVRIYKNTNNLGSAWFAKNVICEHDLAKSSQILTAEGFNPRETAVVSCSQGIVDADLGEAKLLEKQPNGLNFLVNTPEGNYLVLSQTNFPGWKAYIDGGESSITPANIGLSAVYVPQGKHEIELKYEPLSIKAGSVISGFTLIGWILICYLNVIKIRSTARNIWQKKDGLH
ncbi:MAG: hypothetical protein G01um10145_522 [Microgenomates group bacterium Gr01-1014_5]|nr:MAG: hypothetical protein G01um10145_522 [Microgenomates group bacterium Gr01-1014_5]